MGRKNEYIIIHILVIFMDYNMVGSHLFEESSDYSYMQETFNEILQHLNYRHLYHPYTFNSGVGNREDLIIDEVQLDLSFSLSKGVKDWKKMKLNNTLWMVGFKQNNVIIVTIQEIDYHTFNTEEKLFALDYEVTNIALFDVWNKTKEKKELILMVVTNDDKNIILWYRLSENTLEKIWEGPRMKIDKCLQVFKQGDDLKIIFVADSNLQLHSLNFRYGLPELWFQQNLPLAYKIHSIGITLEVEDLYLSVVQHNHDKIEIFKYEHVCPKKKEGRFVGHQTIKSRGATTLQTFSVANRNYMVVDGEDANIYIFHRNGEIKLNYFGELGFVQDWIVLKVKNYRNDVILLAKMSKNILVLTWGGSVNGFIIKPEPPCVKVNRNLEKTEDLSADLSCLMKHSWKGYSYIDIGQVPTIIFAGDLESSHIYHVISTLTPVYSPEWEILKLEGIQRNLDRRWEMLKEKLLARGIKIDYSQYKNNILPYGMRSSVPQRPNLIRLEENLEHLAKRIEEMESELVKNGKIMHHEEGGIQNMEIEQQHATNISGKLNVTITGFIEFTEPLVMDTLESNEISIISNTENFYLNGTLTLILDEDEFIPTKKGGTVKPAHITPLLGGDSLNPGLITESELQKDKNGASKPEVGAHIFTENLANNEEGSYNIKPPNSGPLQSWVPEQYQIPLPMRTDINMGYGQPPPFPEMSYNNNWMPIKDIPESHLSGYPYHWRGENTVYRRRTK